MNLFSKLLFKLSGLLKLLGAAALTCLMLLTVVDVIGRYFKHPLFGSVELSGFLAVIVVTAALPLTFKAEGHVGVEILFRVFPIRVRLVIDILTRMLSLGLFSLIAWQMIRYAGELKEVGEVSMNLEFPIHIIIYMLAFGLMAFCITILESIPTFIQQLRELE